jgi:hypothetical protein
MMEQPVKDVSHNDEKVRRERVSLPETITIVDPST